MARNFDTDPDARRAQRIAPDNLTFTINGRTFHVISGYAPDAPDGTALDEWRDADLAALTDAEFAAVADRTILRFLKPGQEKDWAAARDPKSDNPITGFDLVDVVTWLLEAVVNRPLEPSSASSPGSTSPTAGAPTAPAGAIGRPLTVASRSPEEVASQA
jgi:hypothetical protein